MSALQAVAALVLGSVMLACAIVWVSLLIAMIRDEKARRKARREGL